MTFKVNNELVFGAFSGTNHLSCNLISSRNISKWEIDALVESWIRTTSLQGTFCRQGGWGVQCGCSAPSPAERRAEKLPAVNGTLSTNRKEQLKPKRLKSICILLISTGLHEISRQKCAMKCGHLVALKETVVTVWMIVWLHNVPLVQSDLTELLNRALQTWPLSKAYLWTFAWRLIVKGDYSISQYQFTCGWALELLVGSVFTSLPLQLPLSDWKKTKWPVAHDDR